MKEKAGSSLARMLSVLDLFSEQAPLWTAEAIIEALQVSAPTGYRYVKTLVEAGLLQRGTDSHYHLGARIIVLDHCIRMGDPVLQQGLPFMAELVEKTGFECVISALYGAQLVDTHREYSKAPAALSYGRGRPRPLFLGAAPKVILACMGSVALRRQFAQHPKEIAAAGLPTDWDAFRRYFAAIRKAGYYFSEGELESTLAAVAVPLQKADGHVLGALSLVTTVSRMAMVDRRKLTDLVKRTAQDIVSRIP